MPKYFHLKLRKLYLHTLGYMLQDVPKTLKIFIDCNLII